MKLLLNSDLNTHNILDDFSNKKWVLHPINIDHQIRLSVIQVKGVNSISLPLVGTLTGVFYFPTP